MADWIAIEDLDLSVRAYAVLKRVGLTTADELSLLSEADLLDMRNMGQKSVEEIKEKLKSVGLSLKPETGPKYQ